MMRSSKHLAFAALAASLALATTSLASPLGPTTPKPVNKPGYMGGKCRNANQIVAGDIVVCTLHRFKDGEYVALWRYDQTGFSSQLNGWTANSRGRIKVEHATVAGITDPGNYKICGKGIRTKRVGCAKFTIIG